MAQTIIIVNAQSMFHNLFKEIVEASYKWHLREEVETLYDWVVIEAFCRVTSTRVLHHVTAANHNQHDVYRCVYDEVGMIAEKTMQFIFRDNQLFFKSPHKPFKLLVTYNELLIVNT